jgi:nitrilase
VKIAALQLSTLPLSNKKLRSYIEEAVQNGVKLIALGEYVVNNFFKELIYLQKNMIATQSKHKIEALESYAKEFDVVILSPVIVVNSDKIYKCIAKFSPDGSEFKQQEFLINYNHWDEESFFDNTLQGPVKVMHFTINGINISAINGFEIHFDHIWIEIMKNSSDLVIVLSASTFGSNRRWNDILKTRAFTNNIYILRVNRIGSYEDSDNFWKFYGETYLINPNGLIEDSLESDESILVSDIDIKELKDSRNNWKFQEYLNKRELI